MTTVRRSRRGGGAPLGGVGRGQDLRANVHGAGVGWGRARGAATRRDEFGRHSGMEQRMKSLHAPVFGPSWGSCSAASTSMQRLAEVLHAAHASSNPV